MKVVLTQEKKSLNEKLAFLRQIPTFNTMGMPRSKLNHFLMNSFQISRIKSNVLFKEGDQSKYVYFVKQGEVRICRKVGLPAIQDTDENALELLEDPSCMKNRKKQCDETKQHVLRVVGKGAIIGLEDAILSS